MNITEVLLKSGETAVIQRESKQHKSKYRSCWFVSKPFNSNGRDIGVDALDVIRDMSASAYWFYKLLTDNMDVKTFVYTVRGKNLTKTEKQKLYRGYKELRAKDIVRRVKREYYMVNPTQPILAHPDYRDSLYDYYLTLT